MKKSWIVTGLVVVVALGIIVFTTKNTNDTKSGDEQTTESTKYTEGAGARRHSTSNSSVQSVDRGEFVYSEQNLSETVRALLGFNGDARNYSSMVKSIGKLSTDLAADDVAALRDFLTWPNDVFPEGMREIEINSIKNDVLANLLKQEELPEAMGYQLMDMYSDTESDPIWKNYCVQFMSTYYQRAAEELGLTTKYTEYTEGPESNQSEKSVDELNAVREAMFAALDERDETIAGTALIGVELLSRTHEEFDREQIVAKTAEIASDDSVSTGSRLTALRMSALTGGDETTADTARLLAQTGETMLMRSAAVVTLGETGTAEDRELLESYTLSEDRQLSGAAELALQKMDARGL